MECDAVTRCWCHWRHCLALSRAARVCPYFLSPMFYWGPRIRLTGRAWSESMSCFADCRIKHETGILRCYTSERILYDICGVCTPATYVVTAADRGSPYYDETGTVSSYGPTKAPIGHGEGTFNQYTSHRHFRRRARKQHSECRGNTVLRTCASPAQGDPGHAIP